MHTTCLIYKVQCPDYKVQCCFPLPKQAHEILVSGKTPIVSGNLRSRNGAFKISTTGLNNHSAEKEFRRIFKLPDNSSYSSQLDDSDKGFHEVRAKFHVYGDFNLPPEKIRKSLDGKPAPIKMRIREDGDRMLVKIEGTSINKRAIEYGKILDEERNAISNAPGQQEDQDIIEIDSGTNGLVVNPNNNAGGPSTTASSSTGGPSGQVATGNAGRLNA